MYGPILFVYTSLTVVSFYDLSVLYMAVMGFQKKLDGESVGEVSFIQVCFGFKKKTAKHLACNPPSACAPVCVGSAS